MRTRKRLMLAGVFVAFAAAVSMRARGQQTAPGSAAPPAMKGVTIVALQSVDLGPEIDGMAGRQLRMRKITVEPGGFFSLHSHKDRPGTVYVLEGKIVETRNDVVKEYGPGDSWFENKETNHRVENKGGTPATFVAVDVFKQP
jgi:quercetin dioxygenase-like cupin family protein